jgi:uncharacterized YccA/Bax inhibitor family protein
MDLNKSGNPVLSDKKFSSVDVLDGQETMTVQGSIQKFGLMMVLLLGAASAAWNDVNKGKDVFQYLIWMMVGALIIAVVISFKPKWASFLSAIYALLQGYVVGAISVTYQHIFNDVAPNIVLTAVGLTLCIAVTMFVLYRFRVIKVTEKFRSILVAATMGIMLFYLLSFVLRFFNIEMPYLHESSPIGIGISVFIVIIAALNLLLDFDMIERGSQMGAPKYMEWYGAFGLTVTLIWLYLEILRLLAKLRSRD